MGGERAREVIMQPFCGGNNREVKREKEGHGAKELMLQIESPHLEIHYSLSSPCTNLRSELRYITPDKNQESLSIVVNQKYK